MSSDIIVRLALKVIFLWIVAFACIWYGIYISLFRTKTRNWELFSLGFVGIGVVSAIYGAFCLMVDLLVFNQLMLMGAIIAFIFGLGLMCFAVDTLFFMEERQHGFPLVICSFFCSLALTFVGCMLIVEM